MYPAAMRLNNIYNFSIYQVYNKQQSKERETEKERRNCLFVCCSCYCLSFRMTGHKETTTRNGNNKSTNENWCVETESEKKNECYEQTNEVNFSRNRISTGKSPRVRKREEYLRCGINGAAFGRKVSGISHVEKEEQNNKQKINDTIA